MWILWLVIQGQFFIEDTEIFQMLNPSKVAVHASGEVYVLNFSEARIQHYDRDGQLKQIIGRKGKGPGEFTFPSQFTMFDDRLYVFDLLEGHLTMFDLDGHYQHRLAVEEGDVEMVKVRGGWIVATWGLITTNGPAEVYWTDDRLEHKKVLVRFENAGYSSGKWTLTDGNQTVGYYSRIDTKPLLIASPDGNRAYLADNRAFKIHVIDTDTRRVSHVITRQHRAIPFDEEWGMEGADEARRRFRSQVPNIRFEINRPEYFPAIRSMIFDPQGRLVVNRWRGRPDRNAHAIVIDDQGHQLPDKWSWQALQRLLGVVGDTAYVSVFEEGIEEAAIAKVALHDLEDFVEAHPIYSTETSHRIAME